MKALEAWKIIKADGIKRTDLVGIIETALKNEDELNRNRHKAVLRLKECFDEIFSIVEEYDFVFLREDEADIFDEIGEKIEEYCLHDIFGL